MTASEHIGHRFEQAAGKLFKEIFPRLGFEVCGEPVSRRGGSQYGFDVQVEARPIGAGVSVRFFIECKGASSINPLPLAEFSGKPEQLHLSGCCPDYWILFSPLRYITNEFQQSVQRYRREYPFALIDWTRVEEDKSAAGLYLDLFKHFPGIYAIFKEDVPEEIKETPPLFPLAEILAALQKSLQDAYGEYLDTAVSRGILTGVRRITPYTVQVVKSSAAKDWPALKRAYFQLDSSHGTVFPLVCREEVVRIPELEQRVCAHIDHPDHIDTSIAVLGSQGCGKTTLMYRLAVDYALKAFPVLVMDTVVIDKSLPPAHYEIFFKKIHGLHNAGAVPGRAKPLLVFIDNPHAAMEYLHRFLTHFAKHEDTFGFIFILFERETRYLDAEDASFPLKVLDRDTRVIIDNRDSAYLRFREETGRVFSGALALDDSREYRVRDAVHKHVNIAIAEVLMDFYTRFPADKQRHFDFDWQDLENYLGRKNLESFRLAYMWTAVVYKFGFPLPVSLLKKLLHVEDKGEEEYLVFAEMIEKGAGFANFPLLLEGGSLRTRHELIAELYVKEKKNNKITPWLWQLLENIDPDEEEEKSIFNGLILHKNMVRDYLAGGDSKKVSAFVRRFSEDQPYYRNVMLLKAWVDLAGGRLDDAKETLAEVVEKFPGFLPAYTELGKIYFAQKEYEAAEQVLKKLLQKDTKNLHARTELSKIYRQQKRWDEAEKVLLDLLDLDSKNLQARTELSKIYQYQKKWDEAEKVLLDLLDLDRNNLQARTELSKIYQYQKKWAEAEKVLRECLEIDKEDLDSRLEISKIYQKQKRLPEAEKMLLECVRIDEKDLNSRLELSKLYQKQNLMDKAIAAIKELLDIDKKNIRALTELSKIYQKSKRLDEAEEALLECLKIDEKDLNSRTELGKIYQRQKRYNEAEKILLECLKIDEKDLNSRTELSKIYQNQKKWAEAEKVLLESLTIDDKQLHPRTELSKIYQYQKKWAEAEKVLLESLEIDGKQLHPRTELSKIYQYQKKWAEAEKYLKEYIALDPNGLHPRTELSKIYQYQKKWDEAEKVLLECLEISPRDLNSRTELSKIYQNQKKWDEAERYLKEYIALDPNGLHPRTELSKIYQYQKKWDEAEKVLLESLKIDDKQLHPRTELSKIYQRLKRFAEAERILKELLALEPDSMHGLTEFALLYKQWAEYEKKNRSSTWWEKKQLYHKYIKESYRLYPLNLPTLMELCAIFSERRQYRAALRFLEKALSARDHDLESLRHQVIIYHHMNHESEVKRLLDKGRRWMLEQPFIKYKDRFQALDLACSPHKQLLELNKTGTFSGHLRQDHAVGTEPAAPAAPGPGIICGSLRFPLMANPTAHFPLNAGDAVFFATYRAGDTVYADFIEPYFLNPEELEFFAAPR